MVHEEVSRMSHINQKTSEDEQYFYLTTPKFPADEVKRFQDFPEALRALTVLESEGGRNNCFSLYFYITEPESFGQTLDSLICLKPSKRREKAFTSLLGYDAFVMEDGEGVCTGECVIHNGGVKVASFSLPPTVCFEQLVEVAHKLIMAVNYG